MKHLLSATILCLCYFKPSLCSKQQELLLLDKLLSKYDRRVTPSHLDNNATTVTCELFIRSFNFKDPSSMDYHVDLYLRQSWVDHRLNHDNITQPLDLNDPRFVMAIWKPEVYFPNAKEAAFEFVTVPNLLIRIKPKGRVLYMLRLKLVFGCTMELSKFPLDTQVCSMEVASFSKTIRELNLKWRSLEPVIIYKGLRMPQFEIIDVLASSCRESFHIGNYSCLLVEFWMRRSIGYHLVQSYLPTTLFVVISWLSFWMDVDALLARTSLGITTLLTVSSKSSILQGGVPHVSYVKAIDVWMGACTGFVFCSLLELTLINCLWRHQILPVSRNNPKSRNVATTSFIEVSKGSPSKLKTTSIGDPQSSSKRSRNASVLLTQPSVSGQPRKILNVNSQYITCLDEDLQKLARKIDRWCRILFPSSFAAFVVCYWVYYSLV